MVLILGPPSFQAPTEVRLKVSSQLFCITTWPHLYPSSGCHPYFFSGSGKRDVNCAQPNPSVAFASGGREVVSPEDSGLSGCTAVDVQYEGDEEGDQVNGELAEVAEPCDTAVPGATDVVEAKFEDGCVDDIEDVREGVGTVKALATVSVAEVKGSMASNNQYGYIVSKCMFGSLLCGVWNLNTGRLSWMGPSV